MTHDQRMRLLRLMGETHDELYWRHKREQDAIGSRLPAGGGEYMDLFFRVEGLRMVLQSLRGGLTLAEAITVGQEAFSGAVRIWNSRQAYQIQRWEKTAHEFIERTVWSAWNRVQEEEAHAGQGGDGNGAAQSAVPVEAYFGGKSRIASRVWQLLGDDLDNYIEPFAGSLAVLLARPSVRGVETVNDRNCYLANFWRSVVLSPKATAEHADWPVSEVDLHSRHAHLVLSDEGVAFRERMRADPLYHDPRIAGWWVWGISQWIGGGWCSYNDGPGWRRPLIAGDNPGSHGKGVHRKGGRPQLADAYDIGRGVCSNGDAQTCEDRRAWLTDWFSRLQDRLRLVRVCCGDWSRICSSDSVTTRLGSCGVYLDPPYPTTRKDGSRSRAGNLYQTDESQAEKTPEEIRDEVLAWCVAWGSRPGMRVIVSGYEQDGYEAMVESHGWREEAWQASGGYGNRTEEGKDNARRERLWCSPGCRFEPGLFDRLEGV